MNIKDCINFTNENPVCYLATVEGDQPRVRALGFWFADETGFYFQSATVKEFPHQLISNPKTEVCFYHREGMVGTMLRIAGVAEILKEHLLNERAMNDRPFLRNFGLTDESAELFIFRLAHGQAHFWTMENNLKPKEIIHF